MSTCTACPLHKTTNQTNIHEEYRGQRVWIVGEAPGFNEEREGLPFVGRAGVLLNAMLEDVGLRREDVYVDNVVRCHPVKNKKPTGKQCETCFQQGVGALVREHKPHIVILAGAIAAAAFGIVKKKDDGKGKFKVGKISSWVGKAVKSRKWGCHFVPIFHPAAIDRDINPVDPKDYSEYNLKRNLEALQQVKRLLDLPFWQKYSQTVEELTCLPLTKEPLDIGKATLIAVDIETTGLDPREHQIRGVSVCWEDRLARYIPWEAAKDDKSFRAVMRDEKIGKVFHNAKFDLQFFQSHGVEVNGVRGDTMLMAALVDENFPLDLKSLALRYTDWGGYEEGVDVRGADDESIREYACMDAITTFQLYHLFRGVIREQGMGALHARLVLPLLHVLIEMEERGIRVDVPYLKKLLTRFEGKLAKCEEKLKELCGKPDLNVRSSKQIVELLYVTYHLPVKRWTKKTRKPSVDDTALHIIVDRFGKTAGGRFATALLEYRGLHKLCSTYLEPLIEGADDEGIIHANFNQTGTVTGRLSSSNPNLQNIPIRTEEGKLIRQAFIPRDGYYLIDPDFSQIELRILTNYSQDPVFLSEFAKPDGDIHRATAALLNKVPPEEVTTKQRYDAKTINFGIIYGMGPGKLAAETKMSYDEAEEFIGRYFKAIPKTKEALERFKEEMRTQGYVETPFGRRRRVPEIHEEHEGKRGAAERKTCNSPIQGGAGDCTNLALVRIASRIKEEGLDAHILLQVHDEIVLEARKDIAAYVRDMVKEEMERPMPGITVPLKAEVEVVERWKGEPVARLKKSGGQKRPETPIEW